MEEISKNMMNIKQKFKILIIGISLLSQKAVAQSTTLTPGSILPNMTSAQRTAVVNPPNGMLVFDSSTQSYWFRQSGAWVELPKGGSTSNFWELNGANGNEVKNTNSGGFWSANATTIEWNATDLTNPPTAPINGNGTRLVWIPSRSAFRVGTINFDSKAWDADSIGLFSFASGRETKAKGRFSTAMGNGNEALGEGSTAFGDNNLASGLTSIAGGYLNKVIGSFATSFGRENIANASYSTTFGYKTKALGECSFTLGLETEAAGNYSLSAGYRSKTQGDYSTAMGFGSTASGKGSSTFGYGTRANSYAAMTIGSYNTTEFSDPNVPSHGDRIFQIGNGTNNSASNALTILRNGKIGVNNINNPSSMLHIKGIAGWTDIRLELPGNSTDYGGISAFSNNLNFQSPGNGGFYFNGNNKVLAFINSDGFLGLKNTDPLAPLHLGNGPNTWERHIRLDFNAPTNQYGNIVYDGEGMKFRAWGDGDDFYFRNSVNTSVARINDTGNMTITGTLTQNSDERLKMNLVKIKNSSAKLNSLNAYYYNWKAEDRESGVQTGLIAQEVQKQFPELVKADEEGYLSVNYIGLIPHLIEAHKELKAENELLKERLAKIEAQLNSGSSTIHQTASMK